MTLSAPEMRLCVSEKTAIFTGNPSFLVTDCRTVNILVMEFKRMGDESDDEEF